MSRLRHTGCPGRPVFKTQPDRSTILPVTYRHLADALTAALTEPGFRQRAEALAAGVAAEDGAAPVVTAVNRLLGAR